MADLALVIEESADPVEIGTSFNYIATVRNDGASPANSVVFTNQLPANVTFISVSTKQGTCMGTTNIVCNLETLASGQDTSVTITVTPNTAGRLDNYANTNSEVVLDPNILNNPGSASTTIINSAVTFTVSGRVTDTGGIPVSGVNIGFEDSKEGELVTDINGNYLRDVASGGIYNIVPSKYGFAFSPTSRLIPYIEANQTANFTAIDANATISGQVLDPTGRAIRNALVKVSDSAGNVISEGITSSFGYYTSGAVAIDQTYIVSVRSSRYRFASISIFVFEDLTDINFMGLE